MNITPSLTALALAATLIAPLSAQVPAAGQAATKGVPATTASPVVMASGEVLKVYTKENSLLLKHGPIANLNMGAMTMEYGVADPKSIGAVKPGDKVRFAAEQIKGKYLVTRIEVVK